MPIDFTSQFAMTINGQLVSGTKSLPVIDPASEAFFASAPDCTREELDRAILAAQVTFNAWRMTAVSERRRCLQQAANLIRERINELARLFTSEHGRPVAGAAQEIQGAAEWLEAVAELEIPVKVLEDSDVQRVETRYVPLGVICAIAPWNFPVSLAIWKIAPALLAGNTVVLKPSPYTPLCTLKIGELLAPVFPPGVLNVVSGGDDLGPMMTRHPGFAKISFTGSTETGKMVMQTASADLKRLTLELGGNDVAIVMPDVDVEDAAQKIFFNAFINSGQICVATKRLYVHSAIYEPFKAALMNIAESTPIGDGRDQGVVLGPLQNKRQFDRVKALLEDARRTGLRLIEGGPVPDKGFFIRVTLVDNPPDRSRVVVEEAFGPVLPMMRFDSIDDVIQRANDSEFGLGASVWTKDMDVAARLADQLDVGTVWVNQMINLRADTQFAGRKKSGVGVENGIEGLLSYMAPKSIFLSKAHKK